MDCLLAGRASAGQRRSAEVPGERVSGVRVFALLTAGVLAGVAVLAAVAVGPFVEHLADFLAVGAVELGGLGAVALGLCLGA